MTTARHRRTGERGTTLLEAMVALSILLIGLIGLMQMQIFGITSDSGARAQTEAFQFARELAAALEKLDPADPLIPANFTDATPPAEFGHLLQSDGTLATSGFTSWNDTSTTIAGVTTDATLLDTVGPDPVDSSLPRYQRRWSVWQTQGGPTSTAGAKLVAVSVTYRERTLPGIREAVLLTQVSNQGLFSSYVSAYR